MFFPHAKLTSPSRRFPLAFNTLMLGGNPVKYLTLHSLISMASNFGQNDFRLSREVTPFPRKSTNWSFSQYGSKGSKSVRCFTSIFVVTENEISCFGVFAKDISAGGGEMDRRRDSRGSRNGESVSGGSFGLGVAMRCWYFERLADSRIS